MLNATYPENLVPLSKSAQSMCLAPLLLQIFKNESFLELTQEFRCRFEQGFFKWQTLQTALEVLDIAYSILLKGTRLELNFKPPLTII